MNFQFSGSIPNVHWHSNSNTMSSESTTEFTILNGRVTVTRAANDTRNDVNVTIVANGRRNDNPRRNCLCHREIRWRNRRRQGLNNLLRSLHDLKDNIYDATDELTVAKRKLEDVREEMQKIETDVHKCVNNLHGATLELDKAVSDLQSSELYNLSEQETNVLRLDLQLAENDIEEARRRICAAEEDLHIQNSVQPEDRRVAITTNEETRSNRSSRLFNKSIAVNNVIPALVNKQYNAAEEKINKCSVCLERPVNSVLYKCGHMCMCYVCALKLQITGDSKKCPVCRSEIKDVIKTFLS